jgi:hypothetical protein
MKSVLAPFINVTIGNNYEKRPFMMIMMIMRGPPIGGICSVYFYAPYGVFPLTPYYSPYSSLFSSHRGFINIINVIDGKKSTTYERFLPS